MPWFLTSEENMKEEGQVDRYLGLQIRRKREQTGKTLTGAAEAIGISPSLLSQIERGIVNPSISTLRAIAEIDASPSLQEKVQDSVSYLRVTIIYSWSIMNLNQTLPQVMSRTDTKERSLSLF